MRFDFIINISSLFLMLVRCKTRVFTVNDIKYIQWYSAYALDCPECILNYKLVVNAFKSVITTTIVH